MGGPAQAWEMAKDEKTASPMNVRGSPVTRAFSEFAEPIRNPGRVCLAFREDFIWNRHYLFLARVALETLILGHPSLLNTECRDMLSFLKCIAGGGMYLGSLRLHFALAEAYTLL